jgi:hypothetical protein
MVERFNPFEWFRAHSDVKADDLELLSKFLHVDLQLLYAAGRIKGEITKEDHLYSLDVFGGVFLLILDACRGDETARRQLKAIHKIASPERYETPATLIDYITDQDFSRASLARGFALRRWFSRMSRAVVSSKTDEAIAARHGAAANSSTYRKAIKTVLTTRVQLRLHPLFDDEEVFKIAKRYWKPGSTLQSLAINAYIDELESQGLEGASERSLKRDLRKVEGWERHLSRWTYSVEIYGEDKKYISMPVEKYTEEWKARKGGEG